MHLQPVDVAVEDAEDAEDAEDVGVAGAEAVASK